MSVRSVDLVRNLDATAIEQAVREAAGRSGGGDLGEAEVRHLVRIVTSKSLMVTSILDLLHFADLVDAHLYPNALSALGGADVDDELIHRVLAVPDHVRILADKCLFEVGVARRRGPKGLDLEELGRRSYLKASQILEALSEDPRLCRYYEQNALHAMGIDDEVEFLSRCSDLFPRNVRLLTELLHRGHDSLGVVATIPRAGASHPQRGGGASTSARTAGALALRPAPARAPEPDRNDSDDGPARVLDLHVSCKTEEEVVEARRRELVMAEKTVLFSALDTEVLRAELKKVVIHQDGAIDSLCDELSLYATGTQDPRKPASWFLVGPTGVGKNYLVECLMRLFERLWGVEVPYLELEGPEFTYPSDINELKGAARGFIRSDEEGIMTQFHARSHDKPFSVILVDEVEKAHPQLRRFFLPVMDRGTMTDNRGRVLHFNNAMIFFTSNVGYSEASRSTQPVGFGGGGGDSQRDRELQTFVDSRIRKTLSPEFINRLHVIHFDHLTQGAIDDIFELELAKIVRRYRHSQRLEIEVTPAARAHLVEVGYSREYGARNLAKALNRHVNIEVSKTLKLDQQQRPVSDVQPVLAFLREMRDGRRAYDASEVRSAVEEVARLRLPYDRLVIDLESGGLVYRRG